MDSLNNDIPEPLKKILDTIRIARVAIEDYSTPEVASSMRNLATTLTSHITKANFLQHTAEALEAIDRAKEQGTDPNLVAGDLLNNLSIIHDMLKTKTNGVDVILKGNFETVIQFLNSAGVQMEQPLAQFLLSKPVEMDAPEAVPQRISDYTKQEIAKIAGQGKNRSGVKPERVSQIQDAAETLATFSGLSSSSLSRAWENALHAVRMERLTPRPLSRVHGVEVLSEKLEAGCAALLTHLEETLSVDTPDIKEAVGVVAHFLKDEGIILSDKLQAALPPISKGRWG